MEWEGGKMQGGIGEGREGKKGGKRRRGKTVLEEEGGVEGWREIKFNVGRGEE